MPILDHVTDGQPSSLPITLIYGPPGARKTQVACDSPSPLILRTENGLGNRKAKSLPIESVQWLYDCIKELGTTEHPYKTLCIDSLDHLAPMIEAFICARDNKKDLKSYGFGEGYKAEETEWRTLFGQLDKLRTRKGMSILLIAHAARVDVPDPMTETYSCWQPKLPKKVNGIVMELANIICFAHQKVRIKESDDEKRNLALGNADYVMELSPQPSFVAKNQYGLPAQIPTTWAAFAAAWQEANK